MIRTFKKNSSYHWLLGILGLPSDKRTAAPRGRVLDTQSNILFCPPLPLASASSALRRLVPPACRRLRPEEEY